MITPANTNYPLTNPRPRLRLLASTPEGCDAMLDLAEGCVADFPDDVERVQRVRRFVHGSMAAMPGADLAPRRDLLFVLGTLIDALALDCRETAVRAAIEAEISELLGGGDGAPPTCAASSCPCCNQPAVYAHAA